MAITRLGLYGGPRPAYTGSFIKPGRGITLTLNLDGKSAATLTLDGVAATTLTLDGKVASSITLDSNP
jgi:hypothetical protein